MFLKCSDAQVLNCQKNCALIVVCHADCMYKIPLFTLKNDFCKQGYRIIHEACRVTARCIVLNNLACMFIIFLTGTTTYTAWYCHWTYVSLYKFKITMVIVQLLWLLTHCKAAFFFFFLNKTNQIDASLNAKITMIMSLCMPTPEGRPLLTVPRICPLLGFSLLQ